MAAEGGGGQTYHCACRVLWLLVEGDGWCLVSILKPLWRIACAPTSHRPIFADHVLTHSASAKRIASSFFPNTYPPAL
ncbi:hypothetical protein IAQ61_005024 [Plenodomus lingam]|uniref:uncharacterized protein n=1 Tax=Leptosphaeria maculans TaxID=5022 RepID=UPI00332A92FF|nr:hypothetical protein IAQ61_005024 [Plenodomus lingam]